MENKTAVEWLKEQLYSAKELDLAGVINQAIELEKQQIIDAANIPKEQRWYDKYNSCGEKYYFETYKKPESDES
jgi:hypothetical protein